MLKAANSLMQDPFSPTVRQQNSIGAYKHQLQALANLHTSVNFGIWGISFICQQATYFKNSHTTSDLNYRCISQLFTPILQLLPYLLTSQQTITRMAPSHQPTYGRDERVLCFHRELLYEAKVLESKLSDPDDKKSPFQYRVHYKGWKNT